MEKNQEKIRALFTVDAVVFGTDATILDLKLRDGFSFVRKSMMPLVDHLDDLFDSDAMGLRRDYETARIDDSLDVVCSSKRVELEINPLEADNCFQTMADGSLISLDNQIRAIRFLVECPLRCKKIMFRLTFGNYKYQDLFHVNESMATHSISHFHCTKGECETLGQNVAAIDFPLCDAMLNICHMHYDMSYHQNRHIAMTLLVAALEMLYLKKEEGKKEKLAKRCSINLFSTREDILACYRELKTIYKKRSEFVHEGLFREITDQDILFLRKCVRESILKMKDTPATKMNRIKQIREQVEAFGEW